MILGRKRKTETSCNANVDDLPPIEIPYARHYLDNKDFASVRKALQGTTISRGALVAEFEKDLAKYCSAPFAVAFNSGSAALLAACIALRLGPNDRVFVPANSFIATATCAAILGCSMTFIDIDPNTGLMDIDRFCANFTPNNRGKSALLAVHFAGRTVDLRRLRQKLNQELLIVEDAAHAVGGKSQSGKMVGSCDESIACAFSFHASKNMTTGEGGAVLTRCKQLAHSLRRARDSGIERDSARQKRQPPGPWYYEVHEVSGNLHLTEFQAALGRSQLRKLKDFKAAKDALVSRYVERLRSLPAVILPPFSTEKLWHFHLFFLKIDFTALGRSRDELMRHLRKHAIGSQVHYIPLYRHPCWEKDQWGRTWTSLEPLSGCELFYSQMLSLPLYVQLSECQVDAICDEVRHWLEQC